MNRILMLICLCSFGISCNASCDGVEPAAQVVCSDDLCREKCNKFPDAVCRIDPCSNSCEVIWSTDGSDVTAECRHEISTGDHRAGNNLRHSRGKQLRQQITDALSSVLDGVNDKSTRSLETDDASDKLDRWARKISQNWLRRKEKWLKKMEKRGKKKRSKGHKNRNEANEDIEKETEREEMSAQSDRTDKDSVKDVSETSEAKVTNKKRNKKKKSRKEKQRKKGAKFDSVKESKKTDGSKVSAEELKEKLTKEWNKKKEKWLHNLKRRWEKKHGVS